MCSILLTLIILYYVSYNLFVVTLLTETYVVIVMSNTLMVINSIILQCLITNFTKWFKNPTFYSRYNTIL